MFAAELKVKRYKMILGLMFPLLCSVKTLQINVFMLLSYLLTSFYKRKLRQFLLEKSLECVHYDMSCPCSHWSIAKLINSVWI